MSLEEAIMPNGKRDPSRNRITPQVGDASTRHASEGLERLQQGAARVGESVREGYEAARENVAQQYERAEGLVATYPAPAVLFSFGLGFGLGMVLALSFNKQESSTWGGWHIPDALRDIPERMRHVPESIARRWA
jgi:hypothetical protein